MATQGKLFLFQPFARSAHETKLCRPHADDLYEGMLIPKGSTIFLGIWALHHDEKLYPQHEDFNPDRYLDHHKLANEYAVSPDYNNRDE